MHVDSFHQYGLTVDQQASTLDFDRAESHAGGNVFAALSVGPAGRDEQAVEVGCLGRPSLDVGDGSVEVNPVRVVGIERNGLLTLSHDLRFAGRAVGQLVGDGHRLCAVPVVLQNDAEVKQPVGKGRVERRLHLKVGHPGLRLGIEIDLTLKAGEPPEILPLEIVGVGEAVHLHGQCILAGTGQFGNVELHGNLTRLRHAHELTVQVEIGGPLHRLGAEEDAFALPRGGQVEFAAVGTGGVPRLGYQRGIVLLQVAVESR